MNIVGIFVGAVAFLSIAISRYLTIKGEYYLSKRLWVGFLFLGISLLVASLFVDNDVVSILLGILAFNFLWGIGEVIEQEKRVLKGWFPKNPKRTYNK
ncbi:MAG: DUF4491 family protein [Bacteroidales bacterium]|nr:DUF4491 family protein [Bacteroidales bacterium]